MRLLIGISTMLAASTALAGPYHFQKHPWDLCIDPGNYYYESTQFEAYPGYSNRIGSYYYYPGYYYFEPKYYFPKKGYNHYPTMSDEG